MRYFFTAAAPPLARILLVESGSRSLLESLIPALHAAWGEHLVIDLVTCFAGAPSTLRSTASVYRVADYSGPEGRARLLALLKPCNYTVIGIICAAEPIMNKWKWWLAWKLPAKLFIVNENGDYFWFDRFHKGIISHFAMYRAGLTGAGAAPTIARLLLFPFTLAYLILFAAWVHAKRALRA